MTSYDPHLHHRRSIRLKGYDYSQPGAYFITLVSWRRDCLFGEIIDGVMQLNSIGKIIQSEWQRLAFHFHNIKLDAFMVMPNHLHAILHILDLSTGEASGVKVIRDAKCEQADASPQRRPIGTQSASLGAIIQNFKSITTRKIHQSDVVLSNSGYHASARSNLPDPARQSHFPIWQRNYYEHIIRNQTELENIQLYITENPRRWSEDQENRERSL